MFFTLELKKRMLVGKPDDFNFSYYVTKLLATILFAILFT